MPDPQIITTVVCSVGTYIYGMHRGKAIAIEAFRQAQGEIKKERERVR